MFIWCLQEVYFKPNDKCWLQIKEWKDLYHTNTTQKKAAVSILTSDKVDFTKRILPDTPFIFNITVSAFDLNIHRTINGNGQIHSYYQRFHPTINS